MVGVGCQDANPNAPVDSKLKRNTHGSSMLETAKERLLGGSNMAETAAFRASGPGQKKRAPVLGRCVLGCMRCRSTHSAKCVRLFWAFCRCTSLGNRSILFRTRLGSAKRSFSTRAHGPSPLHHRHTLISPRFRTLTRSQFPPLSLKESYTLTLALRTSLVGHFQHVGIQLHYKLHIGGEGN